MAGRPERVFTEEEIATIDELALINCKDYTIANIIGCDSETLKAHFSERMIKKRAEFKAKLRGYQEKMAKTNTAMAIFLGKNELDQADKQEIKHDLTKETATLLGLIDGGSKGKLPDEGEGENAG